MSVYTRFSLKRIGIFLLALFMILGMFSFAYSDSGSVEQSFEQAKKSSEIAGYSLSKVHRWLHEAALPKIDKETGLYIADGKWNYRDTAADCYPFLTWAAWAVDEDVLNGPVRQILHAEKRLCNVLDRIPAPYDLEKGKTVDLDYDQLIFQSSEYVKDCLIAIVEVTGRDEWFDRMRAIEDDIWKHARVETSFGKIPSKNVEVNGEQIQALTRLYTMTGEEKYLKRAERLADYYLSDEDWFPNRLRDHGCEIIGGLGLLLGVESEHYPSKAEDYLSRMKSMLEIIIERGCNDDGLMYNEVQKKAFGNSYRNLSDGWGYNYVSYLCYDMVAGKPYFRSQIEKTLQNMMKPQYKDYRWEGSIDGYADSIEGAIYLLNRVPVEDGFKWVDREMANNVIYSSEPVESSKLWGTMKLQANGVRTVIMHALMHTQGVIARPWQKGLQLGAAPYKDGLAIVLKADKDWKGILEFDIPRHQMYMGFEKDWPRMNTLPEWFTVNPDQEYQVSIGDNERGTYTGRQLHSGLSVKVDAAEALHILVE